MRKIFLFLTPDGITYSSGDKVHPDVENLQVLGYGEGENEETALKKFLLSNRWVMETDFEEVICVEIQRKISESKSFMLRDYFEDEEM